MTDFSAYDPSTGRILWTGSCGSDLFSAMKSASGLGHKVIEGRHDDRDWYVLDGKPKRRPTLAVLRTQISIGMESIIANAPTGTQVYVGGVLQGIIEDDALTMEPTEAGVLLIKLVPPFPYAATSFTLTIT